MKLTYEDMKDTLEKIHEITFELLCAIDDFCQENKITYYLCTGTCLGAARHQGFIPWDGDADLMLPRKDYEKMIRLFPDAYPGKYAISALQNCDDWYRPYAKIWDMDTEVHFMNRQEIAMGIHVDIFPMDGMPDSRIKQKLHYKHIKFLYRIQRILIRNGTNEDERYRHLKQIMIAFIKVLFPNRTNIAHKIGQKIDKGSEKYDFSTSKYVGLSTLSLYGINQVFLRKYATYPVYLKFEGREFPVVNGYKEYLCNLYGHAYMDIPPDDVIYGSADWHYLENIEIKMHRTI